MTRIVHAHAVQSDFLPDPDPERVKARRSETVRKHPRFAFLPGQRRENLHRFRPEPESARAGLGVFEACARAVFRQLPYFVPFEVEHFGKPCAGQRQQADRRYRRPPRGRLLGADDLAKLGAVLRGCEAVSPVCVATVRLLLLHDLIASHVLAAKRLHGDDTPLPVLAKGKTATGRAWVYVRDDAPFGGADPPAALFHYSRDRSGDHPVEHLRSFTGILQADAYAGYNRLYAAGRSPGPVTEAACWSHSRRKFFELANIAASKRRGKNAPPISPLALEAVKRIDLLFDIERGINGKPAEQRLALRQELSTPVLGDLKDWMQAERRKLSRHSPVAKAMDYMLRRWDLFARFLDDGRICLTNNTAERALRGIALGRRSWLFAGSDRGGVRAAAMYTLIGTAKLNDVDPQAWLADVLGRIAGTPQTRLDELLPWNWKDDRRHDQAA